VLGKISGVFLASTFHSAFSSLRPLLTFLSSFIVPASVLGGVTTFLFASVAVSGLRVLSYISFTRRERFILAAALSFGLGDLLVPGIFTHLFDRVPSEKVTPGLKGLFDSITIILSTPCEFASSLQGRARRINDPPVLSAGIVATILNLILPPEIPQLDETEERVSNSESVAVGRVEDGQDEEEKEASSGGEELR
jgi:xanthine/uracil permease